MKIVLIGWPIGHSVSPAMHNAAFRKLGLSGEYYLLPVRDERDLGNALARLKADPDWSGANITVPYKEKVLPFLDGLQGTAVRLKAVNTIVRRDDRLEGHNTDMPGFLADLDRNGIDYRGRKVLVIGSGGAARAVVLGLVESGCEIGMVAVIRAQAEELARELGGGKVKVLAWDQPELAKWAEGARLVVNTSPVGMWPEVDASPWPETLPFPKAESAYDVVYNPLVTRFLHTARARGIRTAGGLGMLMEQGALAFELWTGRKAPREIMLDAAKDVLLGRER